MNMLKVILFSFFMLVTTFPCKAAVVNVPVYLAFTGNNLKFNWRGCEIGISNNYHSDTYDILSHITQDQLYGTSHSSIQVGSVSLDTGDSYTMYFQLGDYLQVEAFNQIGSCGFGVYMKNETTGYCYALGEVDTTPVYDTIYQDGCFTVYSSSTLSVTTYNQTPSDFLDDGDELSIYLDFGLGTYYYQSVFGTE